MQEKLSISCFTCNSPRARYRRLHLPMSQSLNLPPVTGNHWMSFSRSLGISTVAAVREPRES
jgi:hypothetical protein